MFGGPSFQTYYLSVDRLVADCFRKESPDYLLRVDFDEYLAHLIAELSWQEMTWDEGGMTMETYTKKERVNDYGRAIEVDHPQVRLRIPFQPHPQRRDFLRLMPSSFRTSGEPEWQFVGDTLVIETGADPKAIERAIDEIRYWFGTRNADVRAGNEQLKQGVAAIWKRKREELERAHGTLQALVEQVKIPLHQDPQAPKPIVVARPVPAASRPALKPGRAEPELDRKQVVEMVSFLEAYSRQLEVSPAVYSRLEEEDLRDLVLGMLNVNYPGSSGETFSKQGKTDLFLKAGGGGSLIVECKRWRGAKTYSEALDQLFGYLTWRHSFGVLLTFSTNKDMTACIVAAKTRVQAHSSTVSGSVNGESSHFVSRHVHPQDREKDVEVFHFFVDLGVTPPA